MNMKKLMIAATVVFSLSFATGMTYSFHASKALENAPVAETPPTEEALALLAADPSLS